MSDLSRTLYRILLGIRPLHRNAKKVHEENNIDPDDGNSQLCSACTLPIFSTPFEPHHTNTHGSGGGSSKIILHDECANPPKELIGHILHPEKPLVLRENPSPPSTIICGQCKRKCGSMFYLCRICGFTLDMLCAFPTKIMHRSHEHRLLVIKSLASFICGACGTQHDQVMSPLSYLCNDCGFWIHPDCALLPNAIILQHPMHHHHPLFLTYRLPELSDHRRSSCAICGKVIESLGVYFCAECRYHAHIRCATSDPGRFDPVLIREVKLAGLLHFPLEDERKSIVRCIMENTASSSDGPGDDTRDDNHQILIREKLHHHPLNFHDQNDILDDDDDDDDHPGQSSHICNACVQFISPPFYSCSQCPDFFLHSCCANLPSQIQHPTHEHTLFLHSRAPKSDNISACFTCIGCRDQRNGFAYSCNKCDYFTMDVVCALMPPSITHESHGKTHILFMSFKRYRTDNPLDTEKCRCCENALVGIFYECSNCRVMKLHADCALLPNTIRHKFDQHPLKITTTMPSRQVQRYCEICEDGIQYKGCWYYSCEQCDHWFHRHCIPSINKLSKIKLGVTVQVTCHNCPLSLILESSVRGCRCGYCNNEFRYPRHVLAYECSKCYFRMHADCAERCLLKS